MAITEKRYLDTQGLSLYDELIKIYIDEVSNQSNADLTAEKEAREAADAALTEALNKAEEQIQGLIGDGEGSIQDRIDAAVDNLVDGAPEALDTLKEIAEWISNDESGSTALVDRVAKNEKDLISLREYVDEQDEAVYDSIQSIEFSTIQRLFPIKQASNVSATDAIAALNDGDALKLKANQTIAEDLTIEKSCYIDANGSTFEGQVTIPANAEVIIENATFAKPVVVA